MTLLCLLCVERAECWGEQWGSHQGALGVLRMHCWCQDGGDKPSCPLDHPKAPQEGRVLHPLQWPPSERILARNTAATAALSPWKYSSWICGSERFSISSNNCFLYVQQLMAQLINFLSNTVLWMRSYFKSHEAKSPLLGFRVSLTVMVFLCMVSAALVTQTEIHWLIRLDLLIVQRDQL